MTDEPNNLVFMYSTDQWRVVTVTIPENLSTNAGLMTTIRQKLEKALSDYIALTHHHSLRFAKGSLARATLSAHKQIEAAGDFARKTNNAALSTALDNALNVMSETTNHDAYEMLSEGHNGRRNPARDLLNERVLMVWARDLQGALTTARPSTATGKRQARGAAGRFLIAALKPLIQIGPEAAEKIVEVHPARRVLRQSGAR